MKQTIGELNEQNQKALNSMAATIEAKAEETMAKLGNPSPEQLAEFIAAAVEEVKGLPEKTENEKKFKTHRLAAISRPSIGTCFPITVETSRENRKVYRQQGEPIGLEDLYYLIQQGEDVEVLEGMRGAEGTKLISLRLPLDVLAVLDYAKMSDLPGVVREHKGVRVVEREDGGLKFFAFLERPILSQRFWESAGSMPAQLWRDKYHWLTLQTSDQGLVSWWVGTQQNPKLGIVTEAEYNFGFDKSEKKLAWGDKLVQVACDKHKQAQKRRQENPKKGFLVAKKAGQKPDVAS
jgi:hypothetical protein